MQRQYSGTAGPIENCQLGVLAQQMLARALDAGVPAGWVAADEAYGQDDKFRTWAPGANTARSATSSPSRAASRSRYRSTTLPDSPSAAAAPMTWSPAQGARRGPLGAHHRGRAGRGVQRHGAGDAAERLRGPDREDRAGLECGRLIRRCTLELGGKSAAIFCEDGDIATFLEGLGSASFMNNSQTCTTQSRILAPRSRYDEVVDAVAQFCRDLNVGNPLDPATTCGPMASETHLDRVMGYIDVGRNSSARLVTGGGRPAGPARGWFVAPTVVADVDNNDQLAREEVFGPVMAVIPFDGGDDEAVRIANDSNYGLGGSVWSRDEARAIAIARRVRTGTIGVNYYDIDLGAPFGGMKDSGIGRELGPEGINNYLEYKSMYVSADQLKG